MELKYCRLHAPGEGWSLEASHFRKRVPGMRQRDKRDRKSALLAGRKQWTEGRESRGLAQRA